MKKPTLFKMADWLRKHTKPTKQKLTKTQITLVLVMIPIVLEMVEIAKELNEILKPLANPEVGALMDKLTRIGERVKSGGGTVAPEHLEKKRRVEEKYKELRALGMGITAARNRIQELGIAGKTCIIKHTKNLD